MCLAIPGKLLEITEGDDPLFRSGRVSFEGIVKNIQLAYTPGAKPGDYVLVHVGFAIAVVDEAEAQRTLRLLENVEEEAPAPGVNPVGGGGSIPQKTSLRNV